MHELSICQALLSQVETFAIQHQARSVVKIVVKIGPLSGVVPELLQHTFSLACIGTVAEQAQLILEISPIRIRCQNCQGESEATPNHLVCHHCGDWHTQLISGDEMLLASLEMLPCDEGQEDVGEQSMEQKEDAGTSAMK